MTNLVKKYLDINRFYDVKEDFENLYSSHPNYPSVYAITDTFDLLSIENMAIKIPKEQFLELPNQFLTFYNSEFALVSKSEIFVTIETEKKKQKVNISEFLDNWEGIVIAIEANVINSKKKIEFDLKYIKYGLSVLVLIVLSAIQNKYSGETVVLLTTSMLGFLTGVFIVQENMGVRNEVVSKLCAINPNTSCSSVIKSDKSKINKWINFSDLPLLFFGINLFLILLQPIGAVKIIGLVSIMSLPVLFYSVWIQKYQLKKWCVLCLAVAFVVILQSVIYLTNHRDDFKMQVAHLLAYLFSAVLFVSGWLFLKPIHENKIKAEKAVNQLKRFKRNYSVFHFLTKAVPSLNGFDRLEGLRFGNPTAKIQLTIIISRICEHCNTVFEEAFELLTKFPGKISLNILFNISPENNDNPYKIVAENLLSLNKSNPQEVEKAISDWHIKRMGLNEWLDRWGVESVEMFVNQQLTMQYNWCLENELDYTPVKIINGKLYPNGYEVNEMKYFINDF